MILPEWTILNIVLTALYTFLAIGMGLGEATGSSQMKYSKFFAGNAGMPSRWGMFTLYSVPLCIGFAVAALYQTPLSVVQILVLLAVLIHFAKRTLESLFLHKYSGKMDIFTTCTIMIFYSLVAGVTIYLNRWPASMNSLVVVGMVLFVVGIVGNFFHHKLLADLRHTTQGYVIPRGGWFEYVTCPHYLFELVLWLGIACMSQHLFTWLTLLAMIGYLTIRSQKTLKWYREKFVDFPAERKALIPFIF